MDLNARVNVNFARVDVIFKRSLRLNSVIKFFILIPINIKVLLKFHPNFSQIYPAVFKSERLT